MSNWPACSIKATEVTAAKQCLANYIHPLEDCGIFKFSSLKERQPGSFTISNTGSLLSTKKYHVITTKGLQDRNINILDGMTVENKGKLILTEIFPSVQKHDIF